MMLIWRCQYAPRQPFWAVVFQHPEALFDIRLCIRPHISCKIGSALDLTADPERRIKFLADMQDYVDMSTSSTINLLAWDSLLNNEDAVKPFAHMLAKYAIGYAV